ncbi:ankyrin [Aspergillus violaceofuscus CBS 115571]|uniref:Ankyrin n=1 Tax=Aspergillus violaceofuscus (strain CBS 115571) TaxID=1450538 RepID=A0A2V5HPY1_ASPV1|nr:ankyrin [Aspergillus violaceofuscus CBS 115571]
MAYSTLPSELHLLIAEFLAESPDSEDAFNALARTNRTFYMQYNPFLYRYHVASHSKQPPAPAFHWSAKNGRHDTLVRLLDAGAEPYHPRIWQEKPMSTGWTGLRPLHPARLAAEKGHVRFLEAIFDWEQEDPGSAGSFGSRLGKRGYSVLFAGAALNNHLPVVQMLLARGVDPWGKNTLFLSQGVRLQKFSSELLQVLLDDARHREHLQPFTNWEPVHMALRYAVEQAQDIEATRIILTTGVNVNFLYSDDPMIVVRRPLHYCHQPDLYRLLLEAGADPNIDNNDRWGALSSAVGNCHMQAGRYPISAEAKGRRWERIQLLFRYGADPARAGGGWALHGALRDADYGLADLLADKGARISVVELSDADQARLHRAVEEREWDTVMELTPVNWSMEGYAGPGLMKDACNRTFPDCEYWANDVSATDTCAELETYFDATVAELHAWNPSLLEDYCVLIEGWSYCVEGPAVTVTAAASTTTNTAIPVVIFTEVTDFVNSTILAAATATSASATTVTTTSTAIYSGGVPSPTQSGLVGTCNAYYYVIHFLSS